MIWGKEYRKSVLRYKRRTYGMEEQNEARFAMK
jgi:hypothetical protein